MVKPKMSDADDKENPLRRFVTNFGGVTRVQAKERASLQTEMLRDATEKAVAFDLDCLQSYVELIDEAPPDAVRDELLRISTNIASTAGLVGEPCLTQAARSLCDTLDSQEAANRFSYEELAVHANALRILDMYDVSKSECDSLLSGLERVRERARRAAPDETS